MLDQVLNDVRFGPWTFAAVVAAFTIAGVSACLGPAWCATRVDPMLALRVE
jgi:ABC-type thiamin/hydroxymethylpyrimidine transport system permease subunit